MLTPKMNKFVASHGPESDLEGVMVRPFERFQAKDRRARHAQSQPLVFTDLMIGDHYIGFPSDGDDSGHGGFRKGSYLFRKTSDTHAVRLFDGSECSGSRHLQVIKVLTDKVA